MGSERVCNSSANQWTMCKLMIHNVVFLLSIHLFECQAPVVSNVETKILIPNLHINHYQFWLKTHPRAFVEFEDVCKRAASNRAILNDIQSFQDIHANLTFEDAAYLTDIGHGRRILNRICNKIEDIPKSCWGYERNCQIIHLMPVCHGSSLGQAQDEQEQKVIWFGQADFGYILDRRREMTKYCSPDKYSNDSYKSSLECTKYFRTCRGQNLYLDFAEVPKRVSLVSEPHKDIIKSIGGWNCDLQRKRIQEEDGQSGSLQSWFREVGKYSLVAGPDPPEACEVTIEKQAILVKLDHASNMYHYFCNFLNLYATMHLNNRFSDDVEIVIWDSMKPRSSFEMMWSVFSRHPVRVVQEFSNKRVCFKNFIFALLPRMVNGLYYNTPLIPGCSKSGLFDAFNKHVLHRLNIEQLYTQQDHKTQSKTLRITLISRSTAQRKILNELELEQAIKNRSSDYIVKRVDFAGQNFRDQLLSTQNTDILVGMHGAGLTHTLFLPDWASLFEIYDCEDKCYSELARLRGVKYFTSNEDLQLVEKRAVGDPLELRNLEEQKLANHVKFSNYQVDIDKFLQVLDLIATKTLESRQKYFENMQSESENEPEVNSSAGESDQQEASDTLNNKHTEL